MTSTSPRIPAGRTITNDLTTLGASALWGNLSGTFAVRKFGEALGVGATEEDLWNGPASQETLLTTGQTMYLSCTDNTNGVGQRIRIEGLDENWRAQTGYGILTGQAQATIVKDDGTAALWTRIHRGFQVSAAPDPIGDVYIAETDTVTLGVPGDNTKIHGYIDYSNAAQQTEKAMYTVPRDHVAILLDITGGMEKSSGSNRSADIFLEVSELSFDATQDSPTRAPFRRIQELDLNSGGLTWAQEYFQIPFVLGPLTNIHLRCVASASSDLIGSFELIVVPEEYEPNHPIYG